MGLVIGLCSSWGIWFVPLYLPSFLSSLLLKLLISLSLADYNLITSL